MACSRFKRAEGHQANGFIGGGRAHVGQFFLADDVDVEIVIAGILADNHAFVDIHPGPDEQFAALLQVQQRISRGRAGAVGDQRARGPVRDLALPSI